MRATGGAYKRKEKSRVSVDVVRDVTHMEAVARVRLCAAPALVGGVFIAADVVAAVHEVVAHVAAPFVYAHLNRVVRVWLHLHSQVKIVPTTSNAVRQWRRLLLQLLWDSSLI
jgi:hypothetical protein